VLSFRVWTVRSFVSSLLVLRVDCTAYSSFPFILTRKWVPTATNVVVVVVVAFLVVIRFSKYSNFSFSTERD